MLLDEDIIVPDWKDVPEEDREYIRGLDGEKIDVTSKAHVRERMIQRKKDAAERQRNPRSSQKR